MIDLDSLDKLPKHRRDWLEIYGNQWSPVKMMPGTCEACVYGRGFHVQDCTSLVMRVYRSIRESWSNG